MYRQPPALKSFLSTWLVLFVSYSVSSQDTVARNQTGLIYLDTNFENASPVWHDIAPDGSIIVHLLYDHERGSPNRASGHIHFRLEGKSGERLLIEFRNLDNIYNGRSGSVADELGSLVTSSDGRRWTPVRTEKLDVNRVRLAVEMNREQLYVARVEPYRLSDLERLFKSIEQHDLVQLIPIGETVERRQLEIVRVGNPSAPYHVFLRGRAHPWEAGGNWILEGLIQRLLQADREAKQYLDTYCLWIMPMANKDGVARGLTRFNLRGKDLNRNWDHPADSTLAPENAALEKWLNSRLNSGGRIHFAMEVHNDGNGKLHLNSPNDNLERYSSRMKTFETLLRKHTWFTEGTTKTVHSVSTLANGWQDRFGIDSVVHEFNCQWLAGRQEPPTSRHWKEYGAGLAKVFFEYFSDQSHP